MTGHAKPRVERVTTDDGYGLGWVVLDGDDGGVLAELETWASAIAWALWLACYRWTVAS